MLREVGLEFELQSASIDESILPGETPGRAAMRVAALKADEISTRAPEAVVLAADTVVALPQQADFELTARGAEVEAAILGKPADEGDAVAMLKSLQGRAHVVVTGYCIACRADGLSVTDCVATTVWFRELSGKEIEAYVATGEPMDKAGAYGIQGLARCFIPRIEGSYTNVVGLPLVEVLAGLERAGVCSVSKLLGH